jgi:hypothetical protein
MRAAAQATALIVADAPSISVQAGMEGIGAIAPISRYHMLIGRYASGRSRVLDMSIVQGHTPQAIATPFARQPRTVTALAGCGQVQTTGRPIRHPDSAMAPRDQDSSRSPASSSSSSSAERSGMSPIDSRTLCSICAAISRCSARKVLAFSRPWPSLLSPNE